MQAPTRRQKIFAIVVFIATILLSLSVFIFRVSPEQLAAFGYGGMFLLTLLGSMTLFVPAPTMVAAFVIGATLNPLLVSLVAGLGSALGETTGYLSGYATRALIADPSEKSQWYWRILGWIKRYPFLNSVPLLGYPQLYYGCVRIDCRPDPVPILQISAGYISREVDSVWDWGVPGRLAGQIFPAALARGCFLGGSDDALTLVSDLDTSSPATPGDPVASSGYHP